MRRLLRHLLHQAAFLVQIIAILLAIAPFGGPPPTAEGAVSTNSAFQSAVGCLANPNFAVTRYADTMFDTSLGGPSQPALQTIRPGADPTTLALLSDIGSVYGMAYDDGAVSGRERLYVAAYTKRLVNYGPAGAGGIYAFRWADSRWVFDGSFAAPGAVGVTHSTGYTTPYDSGAIAGVGLTSLGDMVVSPDGKYLYVVNVGVVTADYGNGLTRRGRVERFRLTGLDGNQQPQHDQSFPIDYSGISSDPAVINDLTPFAVAWYNYPFQYGGENRSLLLVGVTDTARRGLNYYSGAEAEPKMSGENFLVPPRAYVITASFGSTSSGWHGKVAGLEADLGNDSFFADRNSGSLFSAWSWEKTQHTYSVRGWNPWRSQLKSIAGSGFEQMRYPQPLLTDIEIVRTKPPTGPSSTAVFGEAEPRGAIVLGIRDRTGDIAFAAENVPAGERSAIAQGDTLVFNWNGSNAYSLYRGEHYNDTYLAHPNATQNAHNENHEGALARIPGVGTTIDSATDILVATSLAGQNTQGIRNWDNANNGGMGGFTWLINGGRANTKATNLGDVEVLCSYALVGGRVWNDADGSNTQDWWEGGIADVALDAVRSSDSAVLASVKTDANGRYLFALPPNTSFQIRINRANSVRTINTYRLVRQNVGSDTTDSDAAVLGAAIPFVRPGESTTLAGAIDAPWRDSDRRNYDFGLTQVQAGGYIGDLVWLDTNGDGIQNESPLKGYPLLGIVTLQALSAEPGVVDRTTTVDAYGRYGFDGVVPGTYQIVFPAPPAGIQASLQDRGQDDLDSDPSPTTFTTAPFMVLPDDPYTTAQENRNDTLDFGVIGGVDVWISKRADAQDVGPNNTFNYYLDYGNRSGVAANVVIKDTLPAGLTFAYSSPSPTSRSGQTLTWDLGQLNSGSVGNIYVGVTVSETYPSNTIRNCADIATSSNELNTGDNTSCANTNVLKPGLSIVKSGPFSAVLGSQFTYSLRYANTGSGITLSNRINDVLSTGLTFVRFEANPAGCQYVSAVRSVNCLIDILNPGQAGTVSFVVQMASNYGAPSITNTATISTVVPGDDPADNTSSVTTTILSPDPTVTIFINPAPTSSDPEKLAVGEWGSIDVTYGNSGTVTASSAQLAVNYNSDLAFGAMPSIPGIGVCVVNTAIRRITCPVGDLPANTPSIRTVRLPIRLKARPIDSLADSVTFAGDNYTASGTISTTTPELFAAKANNTKSDTIEVIRPNPRVVTVMGPAAHEVVRMSWGSAYYVTVNYDNRYIAHPHLTREAATSVMVVRIPAETELLSANPPPTRQDTTDPRKYVWELGTLAPLQTGSIKVALRTSVPVNSPPLHLTADISTATPGDTTVDNHGENDVTVVPPPADYPALSSALQLAIHSELDPNHGGTNQEDGVYYAEQDTIAWPAGEVLDFSPRLTDFDLDPPPFPLEYRARILRWRLVGYEVNGREYPALSPDSRGIAGCRQGGTPFTEDGETTCAYPYPKAEAQPGGNPIDAFLPTRTLLESQMASQGHAYWTKPVAPPMRNDVYLFTVDPIEAVKLTVAVDVEIWTMNACPDILIEPYVCGMPIEEPQPPREVRPIEQMFTVKLLVPRSVIGPGGVGTRQAAPEHTP